MKILLIIKKIYLLVLFAAINICAAQPDSADTNTAANRNRLNVVQLESNAGIQKQKISTFKQLRNEAAVGTGLFFAGMALNYTMSIVVANSEVSEEGAIGLLFPVLLSHGLKFAGVPIACARASKATDLCTSGMSCPQNICWGFYGGGWGCEAVGTILSLVALLGESESAEGLAIAAISCAAARDVLWTVACITAIGHIRNIEQFEQPRKVSFYPVISITGSIGAGISYLF